MKKTANKIKIELVVNNVFTKFQCPYTMQIFNGEELSFEIKNGKFKGLLALPEFAIKNGFTINSKLFWQLDIEIKAKMREFYFGISEHVKSENDTF